MLTAFLTAPGIETEDREVLIEALDLATAHNVDFADAYLAIRAERAGAPVCTFDATDSERLSVTWTRPQDVPARREETDP